MLEALFKLAILKSLSGKGERRGAGAGVRERRCGCVCACACVRVRECVGARVQGACAGEPKRLKPKATVQRKYMHA